MKELKDYLNLYLPFEYLLHGYNYNIIGFKDCGHYFQMWHRSGFFDILKSEFKLPLRPLSDMTEEEAIEVLLYDKSFHRDYCGWLADFVKWEKQKVYNPNEFAKLLSKHFDLFGLIEDGLAIDKTTLKINNHD